MCNDFMSVNDNLNNKTGADAITTEKSTLLHYTAGHSAAARDRPWAEGLRSCDDLG